MDPIDRHEQKDNDLYDFLVNFGEFWGKHGNFIMVVVIVVMGVWFGSRYYNNSVAVGHDNAWADLAATSTPQGYRERAVENAGRDGVPHLALLRGAEAYHQQAIKIKQDEGGEGEKDDSPMSADESLDSAEQMFNQILSSNAQAPYRANAAVGLANVAETRGDFDAASGHWAKAKEIAEESRLTTITTLADLRMSMLDDLARPIVFGESDESLDATEGAPAGTNAAPAEEAIDATADAAEAVQATPGQ